MNLRDLGKRYECTEGKLWVLPAISPLKAQLIHAGLDRVQPHDASAEESGNHIINNARSVFVILEVYILDIEWKVENTISDYWSAREGETIETRWNLFTYLVDSSEWGFIIDAWEHARPKDILVSSDVDEAEKKVS
jgi:hypothetical protein